MEKHTPKLTIIIPVFNEAKTIVQAIEQVNELRVDKEIIVVDDASTDGTSELIAAARKKTRFELITHPVNQGKAAGVLHGVAMARGEYFVVEDADLELDPRDFMTMLALLEQDPALDMVNGDRVLAENASSNLISKVASVCTRMLLKILYGKSIKDMLSSYKVCKIARFKQLNLHPHRFTLETEWLIKALKSGWNIKEVDIAYYPRKAKAGKKINLWDGVEIILSIIKLRFTN